MGILGQVWYLIVSIPDLCNLITLYKTQCLNISCNKNFLQACDRIFSYFTSGIWKVLSMVFCLSDRITNPFMFGIILTSFLSSMLLHKFHEDIIMQTQKILL